MHDLAATRTDLAAEVDWSGCRVPVHPLTDCCAWHVKAGAQAAAVAAQLALPASGRATAQALAIGPGDWLMIATASEMSALAAMIMAVPGAYAVDVSDALLVLDVGAAGPLMARLTGVEEARFGDGHVARTRLANVPVIFTTSCGRVRMILDVSHARHMRAFLEIAT